MFPMIMSLCGNLMGFYISLQFLNIFFEKGEQKERFIRYIAFLAFFLFNSVVSLILNWPPLVLLSTSMAGIFLMTLTYRGKWKTRIIAALLVGGLHLVLEDVSYRLLIVLHSEYIIPLILAVTDLLFFLCMIVAKKIADKKKGQEIPPFGLAGGDLDPGNQHFLFSDRLRSVQGREGCLSGRLMHGIFESGRILSVRTFKAAAAEPSGTLFAGAGEQGI